MVTSAVNTASTHIHFQRWQKKATKSQAPDNPLLANPLPSKPKSRQCDIPDTSQIIEGPCIRNPLAHSVSQELSTVTATQPSKKKTIAKTGHITVSVTEKKFKASTHKPVGTTKPCSKSGTQSNLEFRPVLAAVDFMAQTGNHVQLSMIQEVDDEDEYLNGDTQADDGDLDYVEQEEDNGNCDESFEIDGITTDEESEVIDGAESVGVVAKPELVKHAKSGPVKRGKVKKGCNIPELIKFMVPYRNQFGQTLICNQNVDPNSLVRNVKAAIESILGIDILPEKDHGELVAHFYKDPMKRCFALVTEENWEEIKVEWAIHAAKKGKDVGIEIIVPRKYFEHLEEVVKANSIPAPNARTKTKVKDVNPFLLAKADTDTAHLPDSQDLVPEKTTEYRRQKSKLIEAWPCKEHPNVICMLRALNGHHKVLNFEGELAWVLALLNETEGVDLEHPPDIEYFKFFYHTQGLSNTPLC
ncbi:hypothetical protein K439DRAFT_1614570 [Ramaria rubella]|nr:hypothetical protein K439DRAFT_1614570 [Ramaria rubella]